MTNDYNAECQAMMAKCPNCPKCGLKTVLPLKGALSKELIKRISQKELAEMKEFTCTQCGHEFNTPKPQKEEWGSPEMQKKAKERLKKETKLLMQTMKTKEALAEYAVIQQSGLAKTMWLYETAYNLLTPEQKAEFDKIAQTTD